MSSKPTPQEFADMVLAAFEAAGATTDTEVAASQGPSTTTMTKLRKVRDGAMTMNEPRGDVLTRIDNAARWSPGSARKLWRKGDVPRPAPVNLDKKTPGMLRPKQHDDPMLNYVEELETRITELEERLDLIEAGQAPRAQDYRSLLGDALEGADAGALPSGSYAHGTKARPREDHDVDVDVNIALREGQPYVDEETRRAAEEKARAALQEVIEKHNSEALDRLDSENEEGEVDDSTPKRA